MSDKDQSKINSTEVMQSHPGVMADREKDLKSVIFYAADRANKIPGWFVVQSLWKEMGAKKNAAILRLFLDPLFSA